VRGLKQTLDGGGTAVMVNLTFNSPNLVEHLAALGFDAVMLDCEHTSASVESIEELARAARAAGIAAIVRPDHYVFGVAGKDSTALPVNRIGPVGAPVVEPPAGSSDTA